MLSAVSRRLAACRPRPPVSNLCRGASSLPRGAAHPAAANGDDAPPPVSDSPPPPTPSSPSGLKCGGFFFTCDPNVGLWNDTVNPTWRLTFTDAASQEKVRVPYAIATKNQGPHFELALRLQFGWVSCDGNVAEVPQSLNVESGWEATFPAGPVWPVRICQSKISLGGVPATVSCIDLPIGFSMGFQRVVSGHGVKGINEASSWRSDGAMAAGGLAALYGMYSVATMPWTWMNLWEEFEDALDDSDARMIFEEMDEDGDGFVNREDLRHFLASQGDTDVGEADAIFDALDVSGTGRISFEEFEASLDALMEAVESGQMQGQMQGQFGAQPQGYGQPPPGQFVNQMRPFGGAFDSGMGMGRQPGGGYPGPPGGFMGPGPVGPGPRPPNW